MSKREWATILAVVMVALAVGCSESSAPDRSVAVYGDYEAVQFGADATTGDPWSDRFDLRFDLWGTIGTESAGARAFPGATYSTGPGGTLLIAGDTSGVINRTGDVMAGGTLSMAPEINIWAAVRAIRGVSSEVVRGDYILCVAGRDALSGACWTSLRSGTVNGSELTWMALSDSRGHQDSGALDIEVYDGLLSLGTEYFGAASFDGNVLVASGDDEILVAIRKQEWSAPQLVGSYVGYTFTADERGPIGLCYTSRFTLDANGMGGASLHENRSTGVEDAQTLLYNVSENGFLFLNGARVGVVERLGEVFAGVDTDWGDGTVGFRIGIRTR